METGDGDGWSVGGGKAEKWCTKAAHSVLGCSFYNILERLAVGFSGWTSGALVGGFLSGFEGWWYRVNSEVTESRRPRFFRVCVHL